MQQVAIDEKTKSFAELLEEEWAVQSEVLAEKHLDAAIEAKIAEIDDTDNNSVGVGYLDDHEAHDGTRSNKSTCYSPYVPSNALRILAMIDLVQFDPDKDVFCDFGCGDGRVCFVVASAVAAAGMVQQQYPENDDDNNDKRISASGFHVIGVDVSNDCINVAEERLSSSRSLPDVVKQSTTFYQADLTVDPTDLLAESSLLRKDLLLVTVIYLYTFPTLLVQLLPLLSQLFEIGHLRKVVTLTYHIHQQVEDNHAKWTYELDRVNEEHDLCLYTHLSLQSTPTISIPE